MNKPVALLMAVSLTAVLFAGCGTGASNSENQQGGEGFPFSNNAENTYMILVRNADDASPVSDVMVQLCSDTMCLTAQTDASGVAVFETDPGNYTAHILKVPEGYEKTKDEIAMTADSRMASFDLKGSSAAAGSADEDEGYNDKYAAEWDFPMSGFSLAVPDGFKNCKGQIYGDDNGESEYGTEVYLGNIVYVARTDEESAALEKLAEEAGDEFTAELKEKIDEYYDGRNPSLAYLACVKKDKPVEEVIENELNGIMFKEKTLLKETDKYNYYFLVPDYSEYMSQLQETFGEELYSEFQAIINDTDTIKAGVSVKEPLRPVTAAEIGTQIVFETTDLDGNAVSSKDLFAGNKVTMINIWATWCPPCKFELPELEKLSKELADKDCGIIGIVKDTVEEDTAADEAKKILSNAGVTYTNIAANDDILNQLPRLAMPTTYFVDSEGRVLTVPVKGAYLEKYTSKIEEALKSVGN